MSIMACNTRVVWQLLLFCVVLSCLLLGFAWNTDEQWSLGGESVHGSAGHDDTASWCRIPEPAESPQDGLDDSAKLFEGEAILRLQVERLAAAVNIPTVSYDDNVDVDEDVRWRIFGTLHEKLESLFPLV
jgi:hypothetical protein